MIVYLDASLLVRAYLMDEPGHTQVAGLLARDDLALVTGTWTRIEVSGALARAAQTHRGDADSLLRLLDSDLSSDGRIAVVAADQGEVESTALRIVRAHAVRAMDAWHLAVASITLPALAEPGEPQRFATRDIRQGEVAVALGLDVL